MDDSWKYNGDIEDVKRTQSSSISISVQRPDTSQLASGSSSEREAEAPRESVMRLPTPTPPYSSLSQDQAATSKDTLSSISSPDLTSELGEGRSSPQAEVPRSQVSLERPFNNLLLKTKGFKSENHISHLWA